MFLVFKRMFYEFRMGVIFLALFLQPTASEAEVRDGLNPMEVFHDEERPMLLESQSLLQSLEISLQVKVFVINQDEPYLNPLSFRVFLQCEQGPIAELQRVKVHGEKKTYCRTFLPEIIKNPSLFKDEREYLVLSGFRFHGGDNECGTSLEEELEVYPIEELTEICP